MQDPQIFEKIIELNAQVKADEREIARQKLVIDALIESTMAVYEGWKDERYMIRAVPKLIQAVADLHAAKPPAEELQHALNEEALEIARLSERNGALENELVRLNEKIDKYPLYIDIKTMQRLLTLCKERMPSDLFDDLSGTAYDFAKKQIDAEEAEKRL